MTLDQALQGTKPVLVEFYSTTCPHCQVMEPIMKGLKMKFAGKAEIFEIDGYADKDVTRKYHVHSFPTYILFKDGQECWRDGGEKPMSELTDMLHRFE